MQPSLRHLALEYDKDGEPDAGILHISRAVTWPDPDTRIVKEPKTAAGVRDVEIPPHLLPFLLDHLGKWSAPGDNGTQEARAPLAAARVYQHASAERDREIARRLSALATSIDRAAPLV